MWRTYSNPDLHGYGALKISKRNTCALKKSKGDIGALKI
jgi:hypothetical protein